MLSNKFSFNFKVSILFFILILASLFFYINSKITNQFRSELNKQVQTVVNIYHDKVLCPEDNSDYLLEVLVPLIDELDIPMIITTQLSDGSYNPPTSSVSGSLSQIKWWEQKRRNVINQFDNYDKYLFNISSSYSSQSIGVF